MLTALFRAFAALGRPEVVRIVVRAVGIAVLCFVALFLGVAALLSSTALTGVGIVDTLLDVLGGIATLVVSWLLFPIVVSAVLGFFLERLAGVVEAEDHPGLPAPRPGGVAAGIVASLRFVTVALVLNVLLLALLVVAAPLYPFVYTLANGYLIGREFCELVALRHLPPAEARALRRRRRFAVFGLGAVTTWLLLVPFVNLIAPVVCVIAMVHVVAPELRRGAA